MTHLWEVDHAYYCSESNYFASTDETVTRYKSWDSFLAQWEDADLDYNLIFRWDWSEASVEDEQPTDELTIYWMGQRKGKFICTIIEIEKEAEEDVIEYLKPRWEYLQNLWQPISFVMV